MSDCIPQNSGEIYIPQSLKSGSVLSGKYKILDKIKSGGMGSVYKAGILNSAKICAVKELINLSVLEDEQDVAINRFKREARILSELKHPNLPAVIDYFSSGGKYYLVMDFVDGKDLSFILEERGQPGLPEEEVIEWSKQICDVLTYLHSRNPVVIYRDLKPSNIIIRATDNRAILIDFGIARTLQQNEDISRTKTAIGTIGYMPPEQYTGKPEIRSDIYSLGATIYHLLTGLQPIPFNLTSLVKERNDISEEINSIIMTCVRLKPDERFKSAMDLKRALMGMIKIEKPSVSARGLKSSKQIRIQEDPFLGLDVKKILSMAKGNKDKRIAGHLINILLSDPMDENRRAAAGALGDLGDEKAISPLVISLEQKHDEYLRINSAWALGKLGNIDAVEPLFRLYTSEISKTLKNGVQKALIDLAAKKNGGDVVSFLLELIDRKFSDYKHSLLKKSSIFIDSLDRLLIEFMKDPERVDVRFTLGIMYYYNSVMNDAVIHLERACRINNTYPEILYFIGKIYHEKFEFNKAIKVFHEALKLEPENISIKELIIDIYYEIARDKREKNLHEEEIECYEHIISSFPDFRETIFTIGFLNMRKNLNNKAVKYFIQYIEENPQGPRAIEASGLIEKLQGNNFFSKLYYSIKGILGK